MLASVPITTFQNGVFFNAASGKDNLTLQLDTGAYEPLFTAADAKLLHLPNLGSIAVSGIGGEDQAYMSQVSLDIGGQHFADIPCIVDPSYTASLCLASAFSKPTAMICSSLKSTTHCPSFIDRYGDPIRLPRRRMGSILIRYRGDCGGAQAYG
ncbi:hypothetical protein GCM10025858_21000 [Alicyclobacillus sacchari]|uniref:hypothetical protein n=1 Tax=Alicyclobacillus sacchari TaxID=392010 RepID=UPI0023E99F39|nr:hypothetical protein [Alicyclobacillus sacchari]GMA57597.1 hypothetical protein GCM10025858_21000 [Alicyclobacillus sacchari]